MGINRQTGYESSTVTELTLSLANTGSIQVGDTLSYKIIYSDGSDSGIRSEIVAAEAVNPRNPGSIIFNDFNSAKIVTSIELWSDKSTWKVDGINLKYLTDISTDDLVQNFRLTGTDGDNDTVISSFAVTVGIGTDANDAITTGAGNDQVSGGLGDDTINSGAGDDTLIGGAGNDIMTGGLGADVFKWSLGDAGNSLNPAIDTLRDFNPGQGDSLDLRDLLVNEHGTNDGTFNLNSYITFVQDASGKLQLSIDPDGTGSGGVTQKIVLDNYGGTGVTLAAAKQALWADVGGAGTLNPATADADLIKQMIAHGNLKTDI